MKRLLLMAVLVLSVIGVSCKRNTTDAAPAKADSTFDVSTLTQEQLDYLTNKVGVPENTIANASYEGINLYLLGSGLELYNQTSGVEKNGIVYTTDNADRLTGGSNESNPEITMEEAYEIRDKDKDIRLEDFLEYRYEIKTIDEAKNTYNMLAPITGYENTYIRVVYKLTGNEVDMVTPLMYYQENQESGMLFSLYYDKAEIAAFFDNGDYSYDGKVICAVQYTSVTPQSLVIEINNYSEEQYIYNGSYVLSRLDVTTGDMVEIASYKSDEDVTVDGHFLDIEPVSFGDAAPLSAGSYQIAFGKDGKGYLSGKLDFELSD